MKAKVPNKLPALTFTMLDKGYVDVGADLTKALLYGENLNLKTLKPKQFEYFVAQHGRRRIRFKVYKPKARNGAHTRLTLEKEVIKSLGLVAGDALLFDFMTPGRGTLHVDRTGNVTFRSARKLSHNRSSSSPQGRRTVRALKKPKGKANPIAGRVAAVKYNRCPKVVAWVLDHVSGLCELCKKPAPFAGLDGAPFLETHHIHSLAKGGPDVVENVAALCPNCHRASHFSPDAAVLADRLRLIVQSRNWD